jgi:hypothetical protein
VATRYEKGDGIDSAISFNETIKATREELRDLVAYIVKNNKNLRLPLQGLMTIDRVKRELDIKD